jgi:hypothetical protein
MSNVKEWKTIFHAVLENKAPVCSAADTALACFHLWQCSMQKSESKRMHGMIQEWGFVRVFVCSVQRPSGGNSMGGQGSGCHRQEARGRHQPPGIRCAFADAPLALTHRSASIARWEDVSPQGAMEVGPDTMICSASCLSKSVTVIAACNKSSMRHMQRVALQSPAASAETSALTLAAMSSMDPMQLRAPSARLGCGFLRAWQTTSLS